MGDLKDIGDLVMGPPKHVGPSFEHLDSECPGGDQWPCAPLAPIPLTVVQLRDDHHLSWALVAQRAGLAGPSQARRAYERLAGRSSATSVLPGRKPVQRRSGAQNRPQAPIVADGCTLPHAERIDAYGCTECGKVWMPEDDIHEPLYECGSCGDVYRRCDTENGYHRCPQCNKFGGKLADVSCPEGCTSEMEGAEAYSIAGAIFVPYDPDN